jgi:hypothetical protein
MNELTVTKVVAKGKKREIHFGNLVYYFDSIKQIGELANNRREHTVMRDLLNDLIDSGDIKDKPGTIINRKYIRAKAVKGL